MMLISIPKLQTEDEEWHDQLISNKEFQKGQRVLLYDTRLHIFPGKLSQGGRDCKKSKGRNQSEIGAKQSENRAKTRLCEISQHKGNLCEISTLLPKPFRNTLEFSARIFAAAKPSLAHVCHFAAQEPHFTVHSLLEPDTRQTSGHLSGRHFQPNFGNAEMARTRGAKSSSPSSRKRVPRGSPFQIPFLSLRGQKQFLLRRSPRRRSLRRGVISPG
ncbi:hypothetical protein CK203_045193 [Vitis vinifera]|uniref:Uncharacterized protein n=1 Tax=Vitis vinifera TaxID=29760 RepID=A0A438H4H0_VITVI|nr:hypothetical protein CK203_045193 [Vitis vinifera]